MVLCTPTKGGFKMKDKVHPALKRSEFRKWLKGHRDQVVGQSASGSYCPIARYLNDQVDGKEIYYTVTQEYCREYKYVRNSSGFQELFLLPKWVQRFVALIDSTVGGAVTQARALEAFEISGRAE